MAAFTKPGSYCSPLVSRMVEAALFVTTALGIIDCFYTVRAQLQTGDDNGPET